MKFKIPKKFSLHGDDIIVKYSDDLINNGNLGLAVFDKNTIILQNTKKDIMISVFFHELVHFLMNKAGEKDLCSNEKFIEVISGLLNQAIKSMEY